MATSASVRPISCNKDFSNKGKTSCEDQLQVGNTETLCNSRLQVANGSKCWRMPVPWKSKTIIKESSLEKLLIYKSTNIFLQNLWTSRGFFLRQRPIVFPLSTKGPLPSSPNHYDQTCGHEPKVPCTSLQCLSTNKKEKLGDLTKQGQQSDANHVLGRFWLNMLNIKKN